MSAIERPGRAAVVRFLPASRLATASRLCVCAALLLMAACRSSHSRNDVDAGPPLVEKPLNPDEGGTVELTNWPTLMFPAGALPAGGEIVIRVSVSEMEPPPTLDGFTLYAATRASAFDLTGREKLLCYVLRPPIAHQRIERRPDGWVRIALKRAFADGTLAIEMDPLSLLCRLATSVCPASAALSHGQVRRRTGTRQQLSRAHQATVRAHRAARAAPRRRPITRAWLRLSCVG